MSSSESDPTLIEAFGALLSPRQFIEYAVIDAFQSEGAFGGNPAAVVLLSEWKDEEWLQNVAAEFNLSETAYIVKRQKEVVEGGSMDGEENIQCDAEKLEGNSNVDAKPQSKDDSALRQELKHVIHEYDLRWFTPLKEVDLCGHATLASAHLLYHTGLVQKKDTIFFHTKSGILSVRFIGPEEKDSETLLVDGSKSPQVDLVELNFPWITSTPSTVSAVQALPSTLSNVQVIAVAKAANNLIVELATSEDVEKLQPDMQELLNCDSDGLIATAPGGPDSQFDFVSRCFFPKFGINEDPVTGSAHAGLGPYWSTKLGKKDLLAYQASKRGGTLILQLDKRIGRVYIRGQANVVMIGAIVK